MYRASNYKPNQIERSKLSPQFNRPKLRKWLRLSPRLRVTPYPAQVLFFLTVNCQLSAVNFF